MTSCWQYAGSQTIDISHIEGLIPREFGRDAVEIPGARKLLSALDACQAAWAVVTSGTSALVNGWIEAMGLVHPKHLVVAEDVLHGKPDPACYLLGKEKLGLPKASRILVIEDAPSGIRAGKAAGFEVLGLATTHQIEQVKTAGADWIVQDLRSVTIRNHWDNTVELEIRNMWQC